MQLTKWVHEPIWISKVKVIHWPWSKFTRIQHFRTFFPEKSLSRLKSNFVCSLNEVRQRKLVQTVLVTWSRWPPCPYMVKHLKNLLRWNQTASDLETWYAASGTQELLSLFKVPGLTLTYFTARSNSVPYALYGKKLKEWSFQKLL